MGEKLLEKVFSIKNDKDGRHKVVRVLGAKVKLNKSQINNIKSRLNYLKVMNDKRLQITLPDDLTLQLAFNNNCNCQCKFCSGNDIFKGSENRKVIPDKWLYEYFLPLYPKTSNIVPTHAEITHTPEGYKYLSFIHEKFPHINIFIETNGIAFDRKWAELAADNLMRLNFSINAINEEYFKKTVWDKDGIYPVVQKNFDQYLQILKDKGLFAFKPSVSCVINSTNYETVDDFIKMYVKKGIQSIIIFFDLIENHVWANERTDKNIVEETVIKLIEMERVLKGKVAIGWRLFIPTNNVAELEAKVNSIDINELNEKYADLLEAAKDMDLDKLFEEKTELRQKYGKRPYSYYEELTNVCYHQRMHNHATICSNAWNHLRVLYDGKLAVCPWRPYEQNLNDYIKNDKIDWNKFFNSFYYRNLRKNFQKDCYTGCMPNCPAAVKYTEKEFNNLFTFKGGK